MTWECKPDAEQAHLPPASRSCTIAKIGPDIDVDLARRLDRITRQIERLERHITISNEALAVFVRFWLTSTPPLPDTALAAAQIKGRERYEGFVEALGRRLARGRKLADEIGRDVEPAAPKNGADTT